MEQLPDHESELDYRRTDNIEVQFVWNSLIELAYSRVHDHKTGEQFNSVAPDGTHPYETFCHPYIYRIEPNGSTT